MESKQSEGVESAVEETDFDDEIDFDDPGELLNDPEDISDYEPDEVAEDDEPETTLEIGGQPQLHGILRVCIKKCVNLPAGDRGIITGHSSDPYVVGRLGHYRLFRTAMHTNELNPDFNETFFVDVLATHQHPVLRIKVMDLNLGVPDDILGMIDISCDEICEKGIISDKRELQIPTSVVKNHGEAFLEFNLEYFPHEMSKNMSMETPYCYFPMRKGCDVKLYADAHAPYDMLPEIKLPDGSHHVPNCCYQDMYMAIDHAQVFVYLAGWALWPVLQMIRDAEPGGGDYPSIGELLKKKAAEGVRVFCASVRGRYYDVLILLWDEVTSTNSKVAGMMNTHDEECRAYFRDTNVHFRKVLREGTDESIKTSSLGARMLHKVKKLVHNASFATQFTHHQKTIMCDESAPDSNKRHIVAFVGGLDLSHKRWDTPQHSLFRTLKTQHAKDFATCLKNIDSEAGPREPWHDIHSKMTGPIARDVIRNFEERWIRQLAKDVKLLVNIEGLVQNGRFEDPETPTGTWSVQLLRSIDGRSAEFNPELIDADHLSFKKGRPVEASIHRAYCHQIRRAQNYLYFENQYWLGSSQDWENDTGVATHLVPVEVCTKIREKIMAGESFAAYIVIPLFPEGEPLTSVPMVVLNKQWQTMQMMYKLVADAIREKGIDAHPTDYLNFYCLGNRETKEDCPELPANVAAKLHARNATLVKTRRFMVYVHSKLLIVDDEFVIVGSANINQRSMDGCRDTELAIGAYQENHRVDSDGSLPGGDVHAFRMQLWGEHMGFVEDKFLNPGSVECVQRVNELAQTNWDAYISPKVQEIPGHLLRYPVAIDKNGLCTPVVEDIPDFPGARITGVVRNAKAADAAIFH